MERVVILLVTGRLAGTIQVPAQLTGSGQTGQAQQMMYRHFPLRANEEVLFESGSLQVARPPTGRRSGTSWPGSRPPGG